MAIQSVIATVNGQQITLTYNSSTGKYEGTATAPSTSSFNCSGGYYPVEITATDSYGNTVTVDSEDSTVGQNLKLVVKETVAPVISITSPGTGSTITSNSPTLQFNITDNDSGVDTGTVVVKVDGTAVSGTPTYTDITGGKKGTLALQNLSDGSHTITVDAKDNDGNSAARATSTVKVDTTPPLLNVNAPTDGLHTNVRALTVSGVTNDSTSSPVTVTIKLNNTDQGSVTVDGSTGAFSKSINLSTGANTIVIRATDSAGKYSEVTRTVHYNTAAPTISAVTITPNPVNTGATYTISVTVTEAV